MNESMMRFAAVFCCLGMGCGPLVQRYGCCYATATEIADRFHQEQLPASSGELNDHTLDSTSWESPPAVKSFEAVPSLAIKNFAEDHAILEAVFTSPFQAVIPGDSSLWEVVENLRPPQVSRHVLFCTTFEQR